MIEYTEDWLFKLLLQVRGSVVLRASIFAIPCAALSTCLVLLDDWFPDFRDRWGLLELSESQLWTGTTAVLAMLLAFRTNRAMGRFWEGTGLLHQMRGEWFDSISCCVTFSNGALGSKRKEVKRFRHTIVRLMSLCHGSALEEIGCTEKVFETIDCLGLDNTTLCYMKSCKEELKFNRVEVLLHLTQLIITKSLDDGVLKIPPPILSRVYQTLSRGFVNLLNAKKIADTRFPFPYAQLIAMLMFVHVLLTPIMISCLIPNRVWAPIFTFFPVFGMFSVNFIGIELENPFGSDENDLPLENFQFEMNKCLLMLLHEGSDIIASVNDKRCITKYKDLVASMEPANLPLRRSRASIERPSITKLLEVTNLYEGGRYSVWENASSLNSTASHGSSMPTSPCNQSRTTLSHSSAAFARGMSRPSALLEEEGDAARGMTRPSALLEEKGDAGFENHGPGSQQTADNTVFGVRRSILASAEANDALHRDVEEISMHADRDVACATAMARMDITKACGAHATILLTPPREANDDSNIDRVILTPTGLAPFSPVQQASIERTIALERTGPVQKSARCHPSTPSHEMVLLQQA